jgi:hypothetical protein
MNATLNPPPRLCCVDDPGATLVDFGSGGCAASLVHRCGFEDALEAQSSRWRAPGALVASRARDLFQR